VTNPAQTAPAAALTHYVVDARISRFTVQAVATGLLSAMGHNPTIGIRDFSGEFSFSPEAVQGNRFRLTVKAASLGVEDDIGDKDRREIERLMQQQVLESARFPEIVFDDPVVSIEKMGDALYSAVLDGNLSLHGVTGRQRVVARVAVFGAMLRASGNFTLHQSDYRIKPVTVAGGALKLKDELKFSFEIVAREQ
jgi:polyisoprenoid-binding protein YceI